MSITVLPDTWGEPRIETDPGLGDETPILYTFPGTGQYAYILDAVSLTFFANAGAGVRVPMFSTSRGASPLWQQIHPTSINIIGSFHYAQLWRNWTYLPNSINTGALKAWFQVLPEGVILGGDIMGAQIVGAAPGDIVGPLIINCRRYRWPG